MFKVANEFSDNLLKLNSTEVHHLAHLVPTLCVLYTG